MFNNIGKCPKCQKAVHHVNLKKMPIHVELRHFWTGVSFVCPHCDTILGIGYDHIRMNEDLKTDILSALGVKKNQ